MFIEKLNKKQQGVYVVEEKKIVLDGIWEGYLDHDNVNTQSISIYTGSKLTGERVDNYFVSTPSETPWKTSLKVFSDKDVYVSYETTGDQVEADDVNMLQEVLSDEITRAKEADSMLDNKIDAETNRAIGAESTLNTNLSNEIARAKGKELELETKKANITYVDSELLKKYDKDKVYTKEEVTNLIDHLIGGSPDALDTLKEIADALNNDPDFASTMTTELSKKVDKITGKALSDENYTLLEKQKLAKIEPEANKFIHPPTHPATMITEDTSKRFVTDIDKVNWNDANDKKHEHSNKTLLDKITQTMLDAWDSAVGHISDIVKHITSDERAKWNTVDNKVNKSQVLTDVPANAKFTETTVNGKTGAISKADIVALGIPAQDTIYTHPSTHPASMITGLPTKLPADGGNADTANKLLTPRKINGIDFDGSKDITIADNTKEPSFTKNTAFNKNFGSIAGTVTQGNDPRLSDARTPTTHTHDDRYYTETETNAKFATKEELGSAGYGDMLKSVYDTNNNGVIDRATLADSVAWAGVTGKPTTFAPSTHNHTKNQITDFPTSLPANGGNSSTVNNKTVAENVPAGAKFTDKKTATFIVGNTGAGHTLNEVDFLCTGTNDQVPIQQAIDALPSGGGKIVVLEGKYYISSTINIRSNMHIQGIGGKNTQLIRTWSGAGSSIFSGANGRYNVCSNSIISNLFFTSNVNTVSSNSAINIGYYGQNNYFNIISNNIIEKHGIGITTYINNSIISNNIIQNNNMGIGVTAGSECIIDGNICNDNADIGIRASTAFIVTNNICCRNNIGISIANPSSTSNERRGVTSGNMCFANDVGIKIDGESNLIINQYNVSNNTCKHNRIGINSTYCKNGIISGNICLRGSGLTTDYTSTQYTMHLTLDKSLITSNLCLGKDPVIAGSDNTSINNKST